MKPRHEESVGGTVGLGAAVAIIAAIYGGVDFSPEVYAGVPIGVSWVVARILRWWRERTRGLTPEEIQRLRALLSGDTE